MSSNYCNCSKHLSFNFRLTLKIHTYSFVRLQASYPTCCFWWIERSPRSSLHLRLNRTRSRQRRWRLHWSGVDYWHQPYLCLWELLGMELTVPSFLLWLRSVQPLLPRLELWVTDSIGASAIDSSALFGRDLNCFPRVTFRQPARQVFRTSWLVSSGSVDPGAAFVGRGRWGPRCVAELL